MPIEIGDLSPVGFDYSDNTYNSESSGTASVADAHEIITRSLQEMPNRRIQASRLPVSEGAHKVQQTAQSCGIAPRGNVEFEVGAQAEHSAHTGIWRTLNSSPIGAGVSGGFRIDAQWGQPDGPSISVSASATANDDHGNTVTVSAEVNDDGSGKVSVSGDHDKNTPPK